MPKKLIVLAMAVAAVAAMAIPASASAALTLKDSAGKVQPGEWIVGTSTDTTFSGTAIGTLFCPHVEVATELKTNSGTLITAGAGAIGPLVGCEAGGGAELTITEPLFEHLETSSGDAGNATLSFIADVGPFECPFGGTVGFTYETGPTHHTITLHGDIISPFGFCEAEEDAGATFHGTYTLSTTNGSPVWVEPGA